MRIGVVTDTHVGEHLPELPDEVCEALTGVDLIVHAGDLTLPGVLDRLRDVAPVVAVRGNHDDDAGSELPAAAVVRAGGWRIGVTHGTRGDAVEHAGGLASLMLGRPQLLGFHRAARRRFGPVDAVVVGHIHMPVARVVDGVLLFSPGAVYVPECDPWFEWRTMRGRLYRRFRATVPERARQPAVGMLELDGAGLRAHRIPLRRPLRSWGAGSAPARADAGRP